MARPTPKPPPMHAGYEHEGSARCSAMACQRGQLHRLHIRAAAARHLHLRLLRDHGPGGHHEVEGRLGRRQRAYFGLGCNDTDRYFTTFVGDVLGRRPLGLPRFTSSRRLSKPASSWGPGTAGLRLHRSGGAPRGAPWLAARAVVADARIRAHEVLGNKNDATTNIDRCNRPIRPTPQEVRAMHKTIAACCRATTAASRLLQRHVRRARRGDCAQAGGAIAAHAADGRGSAIRRASNKRAWCTGRTQK